MLCWRVLSTLHCWQTVLPPKSLDLTFCVAVFSV